MDAMTPNWDLELGDSDFNFDLGFGAAVEAEPLLQRADSFDFKKSTTAPSSPHDVLIPLIPASPFAANPVTTVKLEEEEQAVARDQQVPDIVKDVVAEVTERQTMGSRSRAIRTAAGVKTRIDDAPEGLNVEDEQRWYKRQRRLIKNRESAHLSRQRKKQHVETLETRVLQLEKEKADLLSRCHALENQVATLQRSLAASSA